MIRTLVARAAPLAALIAMPACNQQPVPIMPHEIEDRFEVGSSTYIRSLAVEATTNSLWVGSSVGVMQIDLASQEEALCSCLPA